jgi:hypothetical protein
MKAEHAQISPDEVVHLDRRSLIELILHIDCGFPVDFTADYLRTLSGDRLRHIALALIERAGQRV